MIRRQVDLNRGLSADARRSKDLALVGAINKIITFWKIYLTQLPWIAALTREVLSLAATSAAAERFFRSAGLIVTPKLNALYC